MQELGSKSASPTPFLSTGSQSMISTHQMADATGSHNEKETVSSRHMRSSSTEHFSSRRSSSRRTSSRRTSSRRSSSGNSRSSSNSTSKTRSTQVLSEERKPLASKSEREKRDSSRTKSPGSLDQQRNHQEHSQTKSIINTKTQSRETLAETHAVKSSGNDVDIEQRRTQGGKSIHSKEITIDIEQPSTIAADDGVDFTNDPHPALETPLLYFILRRHPKLLTASQAFYNFRWDVAYPLQNRIPCSRLLRKLRIMFTWCELFLLLPFFSFLIMGMVYSFVDPDVWLTGHACRTPLILAFVTATRNNILTFLLGLPVERAIKYHKLSAKLAYFIGLFHTYVAFQNPITENSRSNFLSFLFQDTVNTGGALLVLFMTLMIITALPIIRKRLFEFFYLVHITLATFLMVSAFYHTGFPTPLLVSLTWGLDLLVRKVYMPFFRYPRKAKLKIISDTVVELSFLKQDGFDFNPGQYISICVPKLGYLEWHPFSLSSSPKQKRVTLHIRKGGDWTTALYSLSKKHQEIDVLMEGPFGSVGVDFTNPYKYQTVILFSGGIGVTPMQSLCNSLMYEHNHGMRKLKKLSFVWIERDPVVMPEVDVVRRETIRCIEESSNDFGANLGSAMNRSSHGNGNGTQRSAPRRSSSFESLLARSGDDGTISIAAQLLSLVPPSMDTDRQLEECYPSDTFNLWDAEDDENEDAEPGHPVFETVAVPPERTLRQSKSISFNADKPHAPWKAGDEGSADESFLDHAFQHQDPDESPLDLQVFLTSKRVSQATKGRMPPFVTIGRPDIKNIFREARHDALRNHQPRVAVCVCAPLRIVDLCRKACAKHSDRYVAFDFHYEVFE